MRHLAQCLRGRGREDSGFAHAVHTRCASFLGSDATEGVASPAQTSACCSRVCNRVVGGTPEPTVFTDESMSCQSSSVLTIDIQRRRQDLHHCRERCKMPVASGDDLYQAGKMTEQALKALACVAVQQPFQA